MELLLSLTVILVTTAILILWSCNSRRSRGNSHETVIPQRGEVPAVSPSPRSPSRSTVRRDGFEYDVFLSFRGADTRKGFTGHLYEALKVRGVETFIDSEKLEKGQKVEELFGYIQRSKIFVPIFSKGYADSTWCLKEIAKMVECRRLIIPVFLDVESRDVRHQTGPFTHAFKSYRKKRNMDIEEVSKWADALRQVGEISGYNLADTEGDEAKLIRLIVKTILTEVNQASLFVTKHEVGLDSRIADVMKVLELEARDDVRMFGICAMGGMGKTTLAKAVYNKISSCFGACCFISNVREEAEKSSGLVSLQKQLLRSVCKDETFNINSIDEGIGIIKVRIQRKKILLILDDVDRESQLDALAGSLDWFGSGSRIIVTTRDKRVLRAPRVKEKGIYDLKELDAAQSLELFSWHAFGAGQPVDEFAELAKEVAGTAGGLPLALTIFGSHFFDLKTVKEWRITLERLKEDHDKDIHERLKISFDALDVKEKKIFLDIACFFIEEKREQIREHATLMWEGCRFFPDLTIKVLVHKSLININDDTGKFGMHDLIRDMGRKIVQDESLYNPGLCSSRLWKDDVTTDALQNMKGTENVEAIKLGRSLGPRMALEGKSFAAMPQLRMLLLESNVRLEGEYELFPKTLKWLRWSIPQDLESLPACVVHLENIVILELYASFSITQVWNPQTSARMKVYEKLKVLNLGYCFCLMICPDFTSMPHLEKLLFDGCGQLSRLHPSIVHLKFLTHLSLKECRSLEELPQDIWRDLIYLEMLDLSRCSKLTALPPFFMSMPRLKILNLDGCCKISELHPSIGHLESLVTLNLSACSLRELPQTVGQLASLQELILDGCRRLSTLPLELGDLMSLRLLYLSRTNITTLPESICSLPNLEELKVVNCQFLASLPHSLGNLRSLRKLDFSCTDIEELPDSMLLLENLEVLRFDNCKRLKVSQASVLIRLMVLKNRNLSIDDPLESLHGSWIIKLRPSQVTELSDPDDPKLDSITKQLEALDLKDTLWLMEEALAIDESELLETRRLGRSLHGLLRKRFQETNFQHLLNFLTPGSLGQSSYARSLSLLLPEGFMRGRLYLILDECSPLDSFVVHVDITRALGGQLLFQTSTQAQVPQLKRERHDRVVGYLQWTEESLDLVDWNEVPHLKLEWHDDGCLPTLVMMHVSISGCLPKKGYLDCSNMNGLNLRITGVDGHDGQFVVLEISCEVHHAACNTEDKLEAHEL